MARRLFSIEGNSQRLDGGAMFGNAPRALWERWVKPDAQNRIPLACRALLVEEDGRRILFETGIGVFFEPKLKERFGVVEEEHVLLTSLARHGLTPAEIDIVVLSHLHFDHAGGLLSAFSPGEEARLLFDRAQIVVSRAAWARACDPHARDKASYIPRLQTLLEAQLAAGKMTLVEGADASVLGAGYRFHFSEGHTPGLLLTEIEMPAGPVVFAADLIPGRPWVHVPITMGYDRYAERLIDEKRALLLDLHNRQGRLYLTHDAEVALCGIHCDERGRFSASAEVDVLNGLEA